MGLPKEVAVFYDFCSLYQWVRDGRTPPQEKSFQAALSQMQVWYAHTGTTVILMTMEILGSTALAYEARGWPAFEKRVSMVWNRIQSLGVHPRPGLFQTCCSSLRRSSHSHAVIPTAK